MDGEEGDSVHGEFEESTVKAGLRRPNEPTSEERREHEMTHIPFRSWCRHCVRGKAKRQFHSLSDQRGQEKAKNTIYIDYFYMGRREEECLPILMIAEELSSRTISLCMPEKGVGNAYCVTAAVKHMKVLGGQQSVLKSDTERSIVALRSSIQTHFPGMTVEDGTKGESESMGFAESMVGKVGAQARTLKSALDNRYKRQIGAKEPVLAWLINYASVLLTRYSKGADGRTPYERSTGKAWKQCLPEFGETVLYQPLKGERSGSKLDARFEDGVFLGIQEGSAMKYIGTTKGVVRAWTVKRRPESERFEAEIFDSMVGVPWELVPSSVAGMKERGMRQEISMDLPAEGLVDEAAEERKSKGYVPRGLYIRRDVELAEFGYTANCDGCAAAKHGLAHRQHSRACRERIASELSKTEEGKQRLDRVREREEQFMLKAHEEEEEARKKRVLDDEVDAASVPKKAVVSGSSAADAIPIPSAPGAGLQSPLDHNLQASDLVPDCPIDDEMSDGGNDSGVVPGGDGANSGMEIGSLHRLLQCDSGGDEGFRRALHEASLVEARWLMDDPIVNDVRLGLHLGSMSVKQSYSLTGASDGPSVAEMYSQPRVSKLIKGVAFDLRQNDDEGAPWDFCLPKMRKKAREWIKELQPDLVIGCPPCGPYSNLQNLNRRHMSDEQWRRMEIEGDVHLEFCCELYREQHARGKWFAHEHPLTARSWKKACVQDLLDLDGVRLVRGDMCAHNMTSFDVEGEGLVLKPTQYMVNGACLAEELSQRCSNREGSLCVHRRVDVNAKIGQKPLKDGPRWSNVLRRVTLDLTNLKVLQDLMQPSKAGKDEIEFVLPDNCRTVETIFYYESDGARQHRHVQLIGGKAKAAEIYPDDLVATLLRGLLRERHNMRLLGSLEFGPCNDEPDIPTGIDMGEDWDEFIDEVSGKPLETSKVEAARSEELDFAERYNLWTPVPIQEAWDVTGKGPIGSRWIDLDKGDLNKPNYRSRLVIQEVRHSGIDAIFAATPPLESLRFLLSLQRSLSNKKKYKIMFVDIRRAHWTAKIHRKVYVRLPPGVLPEGYCGRLNKAMYGCRDAASCWEAEITDCLTSCGFVPGLGSPVLFVHPGRDLRVSIHGDDLTTLGVESNLLWFKSKLEERYELKFGGLMGPDKHDVKNAMILNRLVHYSDEETTYEADPRHVQILIRALNLENAKAVATPGVSRNSDRGAELMSEQLKHYRSLCMRCNYLALDRPDISYASKELARAMSKPCTADWESLKRLTRYLVGKPRLLWVYRNQLEPLDLVMYSDSDDGGCVTTRKSTSAGSLMHGSHLIKFYSGTQHTIALSSGESEYYAGLRAGSTLLGCVSMAKDLGIERNAVLAFDSTAAKAMLTRKGFGRAKHIHRSFLWLQQRVQENELTLRKVGAKVNSADLGAKHLDGYRIAELMAIMSLVVAQNEHDMALHV